MRFEGVYESKSESFGGQYNYLRFYQDGTVIGFASTDIASPKELKKWFNLDFEGAARGEYTLKGKRLTFSTLENGGARKVDYEGTVDGDRFRLTSHAPGNWTESHAFSYREW